MATAAAPTFAALMRSLGLKSGSRQYLHGHIARLGIDISHFESKRREPLATDDELRRLAAASRSLTEMLEALGIGLGTHNFYKLKRRLGELAIDISHFVASRRHGGNRWNDAQLTTAVTESKSYAQVIRKLGLVPAGGNYDQVQRRVSELGLDTSHFTGQGWNVGLRFRPSPPQAIETVLVAGRWASTHHLKTRLFREGLKHQACELCGWAERSPDGRIPVELDHINGDRTDNRLENLRILCPNCHSLQPTHRGLNQKKAIQRRNEVPLAGPNKRQDTV